MIADIDLWRAAKLLVDRYGDEAGIEAANRADAMLDKDDLEGKAVWLRIDPRCREGIAEHTACRAGTLKPCPAGT